ncbi:M28 family metallopeptidase [Gemmatirosa kalamazoonensis]|uniref:M28 family metallopeptidase n=1 Tax=Gemmatirosa kalamazoonensis TaxID=861299 RepID=UPI00046D06C4|nr:M28 family metallopeptidase [Gemmatirosa kalamazoonensis]
MPRHHAVLLAALLVGACSKTSDSPSAAGAASDSAATAPNVASAAQAITAQGLLAHVKDLAADSMEGRGPGTPGEDKTVAYLTRQFQSLGLAPGNPDGTYVQNVDLVGYTSRPTASIAVAGKTMALRFPDDYVLNSRHDRPETRIDASDVVFVGYGVVAPEYGWDDYKDVDVRGKTIVMLVNDPAVPAPGAPLGDMERLDSTMFHGKAMTYYGRWTYKYEIATQKGAAAVLIVHETGPAGYPYEVVKGSYAAEQFDVPSPDAEKRVGAEGWITVDKARELFAAAGQNLDSLKAAATRKDFRPVALNAKATFDVKIAVRRVRSKNVVAKLEGTDRKDEYVIYTAHWDHLGRDTTAQGDQIFNGALDNATGTAGLLELAKAFKGLQPAPRRSILFVSVTGEEKGLLGAKYYATHPLYPLAKTAADINMDELNPWGRTRDMIVIGLGNSTLDDVLRRVLTADGRTITPDAEPQKGFYYRSDHFEFAKQGVPALYTEIGVDAVGQPAGTGLKRRQTFDETDYHKPSDDVKPGWDFAGAVDDLRALFRVGYLVAQQDAMPTWKPGTEFKAKRDSMMR